MPLDRVRLSRALEKMSEKEFLEAKEVFNLEAARRERDRLNRNKDTMYPGLRVRTIHPGRKLPKGSKGTVQKLLRKFCEVQIDDKGIWKIPISWLAPLPKEDDE